MNLLKLVVTNNLIAKNEFSFNEKRGMMKRNALLNKVRTVLLITIGIIMISLFIYIMWMDKNFHEGCIPENPYSYPKI